MTDQEAIIAAQKGNYTAQKFLYETYKTRWYMICLRYMSFKSDADDALQNGMINIFSKLSQFDDTLGKFGSWSSRIMVNDCIMLLRKQKRNLIIEDIADQIQLYDEGETPLESISRKEMMELIQKLPNGYRTVFNMYVIEGYTHKEISEKLQISKGTSKSQLFKARKLLKEALEILI